MDYVGARYVIKMYKNSQDPSSIEWEQGSFEYLTLVSFNGGSYLSRKPVPGSVGNPSVNPDYWAMTGFYNGQIAALQDAVNYLEANKEKFYSDSTGALNKGTAQTTILNDPLGEQAVAEICNFADGEHMASYSSRDCVGSYIECNSPIPLETLTYTDLTITSVTIPGVDLSKYGEDTYIDIIDGSDRWTGMIDHITDQTVYLKYGGWYKIGQSSPSLPNTGTLYINRVTKIWGANINTILRSTAPAESASGIEVGLINNGHTNGQMVGVDVTPLGTLNGGYIGYDAHKCTRGFRSLGKSNISFYHERNDDDYVNTHRLLLSRVANASDVVTHGGSLDLDLNIETAQNTWKLTKGSGDFLEFRPNEIVCRVGTQGYRIGQLVRRVITKTTDANGFISLDWDTSDWSVISITGPDFKYPLVTTSSGTLYAKILNGDLTPLANTEVTVDAVFMKKFSE